MTSIRNSKLFGTTADYYGNISISSVLEAESKIADYCPLPGLDTASMVHINIRRDYPIHNMGFDENYSIIFIGSGSGFNNFYSVGDKNYVITKDYVVSLITKEISENLIQDITNIQALLDNAKILCYEDISTIRYWKFSDPFTGTDYDPITNLDETGKSYHVTWYFQNDSKEYVITTAASSNQFNLYNLTDNTVRVALYFGSGTSGYYDLYYNETEPKIFAKVIWYSGGTKYWRLTFCPVFGSSYENAVYTGGATEECYPVGIDQGNGYLFITYPTSNKINRYNINTKVTTADWITGISVTDQDPRIYFKDKLFVILGSNLWNLTSGSCVCTSFPSVYGDRYCKTGDDKNQWIWYTDGTDIVAVDFSGTEQYRIEDVAIDRADTWIDFQQNKFIITSIYGYDSFLNPLYNNTIIYWDYDDTE